MAVLVVAAAQEDAGGLVLRIQSARAMIWSPWSLATLAREGETLPGPLMEGLQHQVGPLEVVTGVAEVLADQSEMDATAGAVIHEASGLEYSG